MVGAGPRRRAAVRTWATTGSGNRNRKGVASDHTLAPATTNAVADRPAATIPLLPPLDEQTDLDELGDERPGVGLSSGRLHVVMCGDRRDGGRDRLACRRGTPHERT